MLSCYKELLTFPVLFDKWWFYQLVLLVVLVHCWSGGVVLVGMQAFMRSRRCWFSDIASEGTISKVCPFKLAARNWSLVKHMEYLETWREEVEVDMI